MRMSKHHVIALFLLGIAVCAGFFIFAPAAASSGQGLGALESGDLLISPFSSLPAANRSEPPVSPVTPEDTPDALPELGGAVTAMPAGPDNASQTAEPDNASQTAGPAPMITPGMMGKYDDERLARLINTASISLMRLSMEHALALCRQDADAASAAADDLHALSLRLLVEVEPLRASPAGEPARTEFIRVLKDYSAASEALLGTTASGGDAAPAALGSLSAASIDLDTVNRQALDLRPAITGTPVVRTAAPACPAPIAPPAAALPLGERYTYDDPSDENMVSLLAESIRTVTTYEPFPANESTGRVEADKGRAFLLVVIKGTNLGHKGESDLYTVEMPGKDAFTLEYKGMTFAPLDVPAYTLYGESFDKKTLERYESKKGYIYFDVPETFEATGAVLRADLGGAGAPAWNLEREPGNATAA